MTPYLRLNILTDRLTTLYDRAVKQFEDSRRGLGQSPTTNQSLLVICRDEQALDQLRELEVPSNSMVTVASDLPHVRDDAQSLPWVDETTTIERMDSFFDIKEEVQAAINDINEWLTRVGNSVDGVDGEYLQWREAPEGGRSQLVQDGILLIRSYDELLAGDVDQLVVLRQDDYTWEDGILVRTAEKQGVPVRFRPERNTATTIRDAADTASHALKTIGRYGRLLGRLFRHQLETTPAAQSHNDTIAFQLASPHTKHVDNIEGPMRALEASDEFDGVALCWSCPDSAHEIRNRGLRALEIESFVPLRGLGSVLIKNVRIWRTGVTMKTTLSKMDSLTYNDISLFPAIWPTIHEFLIYRSFARLVMERGIKCYLTEESPVGIKVWGAGMIGCGRVMRIAAKQTNVLLFHYSIGNICGSPYLLDYLDLYLSPGEIGKNYLKDLGFDHNDIIVTGQSRFDNIREFKNNISPAESMSKLSIPSKTELCIFYAPQNEARGYYWPQENFRVTQALFEYARKNPDVCVLIKPHPSSTSGIAQALLDEQQVRNISLIDKSKSPYHCINAADIVITKYSTVGIEAMLFEKPLISVAVDGEERFQELYGDVAERFEDCDEMIAFVDTLPYKLSQVEQRQSKARKKFLQRKFDNREEASRAIVKAIIDNLPMTITN